jgi:hypothetical protein
MLKSLAQCLILIALRGFQNFVKILLQLSAHCDLGFALFASNIDIVNKVYICNLLNAGRVPVWVSLKGLNIGSVPVWVSLKGLNIGSVPFWVSLKGLNIGSVPVWMSLTGGIQEVSRNLPNVL